MTPAERAIFLGRPEIRHAIRANVDAAPPLSETTKAHLAGVFAPVRRPADTRPNGSAA